MEVSEYLVGSPAFTAGGTGAVGAGGGRGGAGTPGCAAMLVLLSGRTARWPGRSGGLGLSIYAAVSQRSQRSQLGLVRLG